MPVVLHYSLVLFFLWLLATAAAHKFLHHQYTAGLIRSYVHVGEMAAGLLAWLIAFTEAGLALGLAVAPLRQAAFLATAALMLVYLLGMASLLARGRVDARCGCAGPDSDLRVSPALLIRNGVLVLLAVMGTLPVAGALSVTMAVSAGLIGVFMIALYLCVQQLLRNAQRLAEMRR
jgi:hypothetical protein